MEVLVFDTETTGYWNNNLSLNDPCQGTIIQLGFQFFDGNRKCQFELNSLLYPSIANLQCHEKAYETHHIPIEDCYKCGVDQSSILSIFHSFVKRCDVIVAHNSDFDITMIKNQYRRNGMLEEVKLLETKLIIDTMKPATPIVKALPIRGGHYKWPKLEECVKFFFNESMEGAHEALTDVKYCAKVFFELFDMGIYKIPLNEKSTV